MKSANRFQRGSGCYTCSCCKKLTRSTGRGDNENCGLCAKCFDMSGDENAVADGAMSLVDWMATWGEYSKSIGNTPPTEPKFD
jgi:hypothetical protein